MAAITTLITSNVTAAEKNNNPSSPDIKGYPWQKVGDEYVLKLDNCNPKIQELVGVPYKIRGKEVEDQFAVLYFFPGDFPNPMAIATAEEVKRKNKRGKEVTMVNLLELWIAGSYHDEKKLKKISINTNEGVDGCILLKLFK